MDEMDDLILCTIMNEKNVDKDEVKKRVSFTDNAKIKTPHADLLPITQGTGKKCRINGETFFKCTKNTWIGDSGTSFHISNDDFRLV